MMIAGDSVGGSACSPAVPLFLGQAIMYQHSYNHYRGDLEAIGYVREFFSHGASGHWIWDDLPHPDMELSTYPHVMAQEHRKVHAGLQQRTRQALEQWDRQTRALVPSLLLYVVHYV
jgi:hypothetical protein